MLKAAARRAFDPTFGALAGGSLAVRIGGRLGINLLFNPQTILRAGAIGRKTTRTRNSKDRRNSSSR